MHICTYATDALIRFRNSSETVINDKEIHKERYKSPKKY